MGRKKSFDEQSVIDAAIAVFSEHGYAGTDVGLVCERANIGRSSFYNTFDSLDAVFLRALRDYTATGIPLREELERSLEPAPVLLMHRLRGELKKQCDDENRTGCLSANTAAELGREVDAVCSILDPDRNAWLDTYSGIIERGQTAGHILADIDPRIHAPLIHSVLAGLRIAARVMTTEDVLAQARAFVAGLCTPAGRATLETEGAPGASTKGSPTP
ncbi:TetR/AcrR family transcriptional regulator [Brevibacterium sediminis]|uniref:TetR/AcrR family transcriptional regulator n=1 Tax=Brevibacterium sediminis TaxID=1857024 RepID=A0A5C4X4B7_9MICO|nr:TetR/AcrR family transcriptional regulator [Brevibacterium sediminis]TNM56831.1 TetR/AcrR family transcriptional regulator [Brevibacterium sediminis]